MARQLGLSRVGLRSIWIFLGGLSIIGAAPLSETTKSTIDPPPQGASSYRTAGTISSENISDEEKIDFLSVRESYSQGRHEDALNKLDEFNKKYPASPFKTQAENLLGLCYLKMKQPLRAIPSFQSALQTVLPGPGSTRAYLEYNLAKAQTEADLLTEAQQTLSQIDPSVYDSENRIKYFFLKATVLLKRGLAEASAREILNLSSTLDPTLQKNYGPSFSSLLKAAIRQIKNPTQLQKFQQDFVGSPLAEALRSAAAPLQEPEAPTDSQTIGVLLPMKGKFAKFGERALRGIELAFHIFDLSQPDSKISLMIEESGETPEESLQALNRLVKKHHVVAVIGPLLTKGIDELTRRAQELRVPLLSLAKQAGNPSEYSIAAGMTLQMQAQEIARHAIQKMKLHRFAILSPKDKMGEEFSQYFWDAVESLGGEITGIESYPPGETDFRTAVDKLSGLYYTEARQSELNQLAQLRLEKKILKRTRKTEQYFALKPIVDYDAVFIPDEPKISGQILPTFAYRDVDSVQFLGPSAWNSSEFSSRAQATAEKAVFVDAFYAESGADTVQAFVQEYQATFNSPPTAIDALAYDAAQILSGALAEGGSDVSRSSLLKALKNIPPRNGVTGQISFRDGQFYRNLNILTIRQGRITEYRPVQGRE